MNSILFFNRSSALGQPWDLKGSFYEEQLKAIQPSRTLFQRPLQRQGEEQGSDQILNSPVVAHYGGVNDITIDKFEGRYLLSGGADSTVSLWDLETPVTFPRSSQAEGHNNHDNKRILYHPLGTVARSSKSHQYGITAVSFYPFDSGALLTSSFDATLKIYDAMTLVPTASFDVESAAYTHVMSPVGAHLLVACGTQHPAVRLVDLRSGSSAQALAGHTGAVLTAAWSTRAEHILATGSADGTVRIWDVRRSAGQLGVLDLEDSVGIVGYDGNGTGARPRGRGRAHSATVNGLVWTEDGQFLVSTGHDERMRVWDMKTGANTLVNFGPLLRNKTLAQLKPSLLPSSVVEMGKDLVFFPSEKEILIYELFTGTLVKRLRVPASNSEANGTGKNDGQRKIKALAWRPFDLELYSAHSDGSIRSWKPWTEADEMAVADEEAEERKNKRRALNQIYNDVMTKRRVLDIQSLR